MVVRAEDLERRVLFSAALTTLCSSSGDGAATEITAEGGALYGTTGQGGAYGVGSVWELAQGSSSPTTLYSFGSTDDAPPPEGITTDSIGNLYGTSEGVSGTVWELASGTFSTVFSFAGGADYGYGPTAIVSQQGGFFYGTSEDGGANGEGTVWKLTVSGQTATIATLYSFTGGDNGAKPAGITLGTAGYLFGTTTNGGTYGDGTVWQLPVGGGGLTTLYSFTGGTDGTNPSGITVDSSGSLYGTTGTGTDLGGTVWELPDAAAPLTTLYSFDNSGTAAVDDGFSPSGIVASGGDLYGTTTRGGANGSGTIFELTGLGTSPPTLVFAQQPANTTTVSVFGPITVDIEDSSGALLTSDDSNVTLAIAGGPGGGILGGGTTVAAVNGVATFSNMSIATPGDNYMLTATDGSDTPATSSPFNVTAAGSDMLTPTILRSTLPATVVAGEASHAAVIVDVANAGSSTHTGTIATAIYASQDGQVNSSSILLGSTMYQPTIPADASVPVTVKIKSLPANLNGAYTLLAQVTDPSGTTTTSSSGPSLTAAAPFLAFSDTLLSTTLASADVSGQKTHATVRLNVTNNGNIASTGSSTVALYASPDATAADGTLIRSLAQPLALKPGANKTVTIALESLPAVINGEYYIVAQVTDPKGDVTSVPSAGEYELAAPFISLMPTLTEVTTFGQVKFSIVNQGNVVPVGNSTLTLLSSTTGSESGASIVLSRSIELPLPPGKPRAFGLHLTKAQLAMTTGAISFYLQVADPDGVTQTSSLG